LGVAFFAEKNFLNLFVDGGRAQAAQGLGAVVHTAQHWGFRILVAFAAALALFVYVRGDEGLKMAEASRTAPLNIGWLLGHLLLLAMLAAVSYFLYRYTATGLPFAALVALWVVVASAAA